MDADSPPAPRPPDERQPRELAAPLINARPEDISALAHLDSLRT
jgi:hypothetical protein